MTSLPDWLVERAALGEVPAASQSRLDAADPRELAEGVAALTDANAAELAKHPSGPALTQIEARIAARRIARRRTLSRGLLAVATTAAAVLAIVHFTGKRAVAVGEDVRPPVADDDDGVRAKGKARLLAFRQNGDQAEALEQDALVHAGDVIQLRYNAGGKHYGVIASVDGAGGVTLHFPASEDAPAEATAVAPETTALPEAYALDDAPKFERFFFITANHPIDLHQSMDAIRALAHRDDSADARLELPAGLRQSSLRLLKPDHEVRHD
ncbi:MAG TPA: hypothetical protein VGG74_20575 [Kofleriaceae bacterium]